MTRSQTARNVTRRLGPLAALAVVALVITGCSNAPAARADTRSSASNISAASSPPSTDNSIRNNASATTPGTNTPDDRQQAVKFAECMRANGVKAFPDPDASGQLTIDS